MLFSSHHIKGINSMYHCGPGLSYLADVVINLFLNCMLVTFTHRKHNVFLQLSNTPFPDEDSVNLKW